MSLSTRASWPEAKAHRRTRIGFVKRLPERYGTAPIVRQFNAQSSALRTHFTPCGVLAQFFQRFECLYRRNPPCIPSRLFFFLSWRIVFILTQFYPFLLLVLL